MEPKCEMKGFLGFLILRMVSKRDMSGEGIAKELEKRKGCKPSPGTVYPALKSLRADGLIEEIKAGGKTKLYKLTKEGQKELKIATKRFTEMFYDMKEEFARC